MTREEAIQILSTRDAHGVLCGYTSGVTEALDMAIEALQDKMDGDLISRQDAIKAVARDIPFITFTEDPKRTAQRIIGTVPSTKPKTGHWYIREYEYFTCSECGEDYWNSCDSTAEAKELLETRNYPNYCPNCGCRMGEDKNDKK